MTLICTGCGDVAKDEPDIRYCRKVVHANGDPCGSLMLPVKTEMKPEAVKPRKEGK